MLFKIVSDIACKFMTCRYEVITNLYGAGGGRDYGQVIGPRPVLSASCSSSRANNLGLLANTMSRWLSITGETLNSSLDSDFQGT